MTQAPKKGPGGEFCLWEEQSRVAHMMGWVSNDLRIDSWKTYPQVVKLMSRRAGKRFV